MDPITIAMLATGGISALTNWIQGRKQKKEGKQMLRKAAGMEKALGEMPKMEIPQSVDDYIGLSRTMARQELPGAKMMRQDIAQTQAATLSSASQVGQGADAMAAVLSTGQDRMRALRQLGIAAAQYTAGKQSEYAQAVASRAPWEQQMWEQNELRPWEVGKNEAMGLRNAGLQMKYAGMDQQGAAITQGLNMANTALWGQQMNPNSWWNTRSGGGAGMSPTTYQSQFPSVMHDVAQGQLGSVVPNLGSDPYAMYKGQDFGINPISPIHNP